MKKTHNPKLMAIAFLLAGLIFFLNLPTIYGQAQTANTPTPTTENSTATTIPLISTPTINSTILITVVVTNPAQQTDELLNTYKEVLDTSKSTIEEVHKSFDLSLKLIGTVIAILSIGGIGAAAQISSYAKRASDKAASAQQDSTRALDTIKKIEDKTLELEKINLAARASTDDLIQKQNELREQMEKAANALKGLNSELSLLKSSNEQDRQVIKKPLTLLQIDEYGMQALSGNPSEKDSSKLALIEMSQRSDAVVRRRTVKALGTLEDYDERIVHRLQEIIESDSAQGVRKEAEKSLKLIEAKKPKKTTRRKP